jgi:hypothetical protein
MGGGSGPEFGDDLDAIEEEVKRVATFVTTLAAPRGARHGSLTTWSVSAALVRSRSRNSSMRSTFLC